MVEIVRSSRPLVRKLWRIQSRFAIPVGLILVFAVLWITAFAFLDWQAHRHYRAVASEVDRLDPGWQIDDLLTRREKIPDEANSVHRVQSIAGRLPTGWPGTWHYDISLFDEGERPEVLLDSGRVGILKALFEPVAEITPQARALSKFPHGNFMGPRPRVERLEQLSRLNPTVMFISPMARTSAASFSCSGSARTYASRRMTWRRQSLMSRP